LTLTQKSATRTAASFFFVLLVSKEKMVSGSESEFSMESVDEREINRRVEFEDGRVVHLLNEMSDERVLEILDSNEELEFYHRYDRCR
jgi:hypothetical protein